MEIQSSFIRLAQTIQEAERSFSDRMHSYRSEMVKRGMARRATDGFHVNRIPIGYRLRYTETGESSIRIDPLRTPLIREAFLLRAEGGLSLRKALSRMTERGLRARSGKKMPLSSFRAMLVNPFYAGMVRNAGILLQGRHEAMVDNELFEQANGLKGKTAQ